VGRFGQPEEVAQVVELLVTNSYMTDKVRALCIIISSACYPGSSPDRNLRWRDDPIIPRLKRAAVHFFGFSSIPMGVSNGYGDL